MLLTVPVRITVAVPGFLKLTNAYCVVLPVSEIAAFTVLQVYSMPSGGNVAAPKFLKYVILQTEGGVVSDNTGALGVGLTVIVNVLANPVQLLAEGVTVIIAIIGFAVLFNATKDGILPLPVLARPIVLLSFVHVKLVPLTVEV